MAGFLARFFARIFKPRSPPQPQNERTYLVYVANSSAEWNAAGNHGLGGKHCPADGRYAPLPAHAQFNHDAWPRFASYPGKYPVGTVLAEARMQDIRERRGEPIEDLILHEVGGHGFMGVGADHDSKNTLMNARNGPKTEADRQQLRDVLRANVDVFEVRRGVPPQNPNFHGSLAAMPKARA